MPADPPDAYRRAHPSPTARPPACSSLFGAPRPPADGAAAQRLAEQWLQVHPRDVEVSRHPLGDLLARSGSLPPPLARSTKVWSLKLQPDDAEALNNLAHLQLLDPATLSRR